MTDPFIVWQDESTTIICGDVIDIFTHNNPATGKPFISPMTVDMAMTSVPYLRQRRYTDAAWGWEQSAKEWLDHMNQVSIYTSMALKNTGTFWFNSGDKWGGGSMKVEGDTSKLVLDDINREGNLMMLPERVIIALTDARKMTLLNKVIWWKRNRAPQSYQRKFIDMYEPLYWMCKYGHHQDYKFNRSDVGVETRGEMAIMSMEEQEQETPENFVRQMTLSHDQPELWHPVYDANHPPKFGTPEYAEWYNQTREQVGFHDHVNDAQEGQRFTGAAPKREGWIDQTNPGEVGMKFQRGRATGSYGESGKAKGQGGFDDKQQTKALKRPDGANPGDVWDIPVKVDAFFKGADIPPSRRWPAWPVELCTMPILACTDPGDVVFDPFAGSGTLGVAAKLLGRKSILIDIDIESCRIMAARIIKAQAPLVGEQANLI